MPRKKMGRRQKKGLTTTTIWKKKEKNNCEEEGENNFLVKSTMESIFNQDRNAPYCFIYRRIIEIFPEQEQGLEQIYQRINPSDERMKGGREGIK